jgi:hypothetical protein
MPVYLATKTLSAIEEAIQSDQGASYRGWLGKVIGCMDDAYRTDEFPFRSHLGASGVGGECGRKIWYGFRWATLQKHDGRLLRLFNRGHLEEARFIAMLLTIGVQVYQQDENGKQYRISGAGGHFGGSGDGVAIGIPDLDPNTPALAEFKTSAEKPFLKVKKEGVRSAKFEHYVQMQVYMRKMGLAVALYMVVNKNNDELYAEIVPLNSAVADEFISRGENLVWAEVPPTRLSDSPSWFECKWCWDYMGVCHLGHQPHQNCRTCTNSKPLKDGKWYCNVNAEAPKILSQEDQFKGCEEYKRLF